MSELFDAYWMNDYRFMFLSIRVIVFISFVWKARSPVKRRTCLCCSMLSWNEISCTDLLRPFLLLQIVWCVHGLSNWPRNQAHSGLWACGSGPDHLSGEGPWPWSSTRDHQGKHCCCFLVLHRKTNAFKCCLHHCKHHLWLILDKYF